MVVTPSCHCDVGVYDRTMNSASMKRKCVTFAQNLHIHCHETQREGNALPLRSMTAISRCNQLIQPRILLWIPMESSRVELANQV